MPGQKEYPGERRTLNEGRGGEGRGGEGRGGEGRGGEGRERRYGTWKEEKRLTEQTSFLSCISVLMMKRWSLVAVPASSTIIMEADRFIHGQISCSSAGRKEGMGDTA